jgi:hypothetical protein
MNKLKTGIISKLKDTVTLQVSLIFTGTLLFTIYFSNNFFFWDTITEVSIPSNFYYDTNFHTSFFSQPMASGHSTAIPIYLAAVWKIFGRTLLVSHLAFFPFIFGIIYLIYRYIKISGAGHPILLLIFLPVILDPALLSQLSLITFDIPEIFFFLLCVVCLTERRNAFLLIAFTGLCFANLRGVFCGFGIIIYYLLNAYYNDRKISLKHLLLFLPGLLLIMIFLFSFLNFKNWDLWDFIIGQWGGTEEFSSLGRLSESILVLGWRLIDYGRIGIIIVFLYAVYKAFKSNSLFDEFFKRTFFIAISQLIIFIPLSIIFTKYIGHRYLIPVFIPITICTVYWIIKFSGFPKTLFGLAGGLLVSGYFWIYPANIAQGWDATPAHWPYYQVRTEMLSYLKEEKILVTETGSFFPNIASFKETDLSDDNSSFKEANLESDNYILFSNIFNIPDKDLNDLADENKWTIEHKIKKRGVYMILYKRRNI